MHSNDCPATPPGSADSGSGQAPVICPGYQNQQKVRISRSQFGSNFEIRASQVARNAGAEMTFPSSTEQPLRSEVFQNRKGYLLERPEDIAPFANERIRPAGRSGFSGGAVSLPRRNVTHTTFTSLFHYRAQICPVGLLSRECIRYEWADDRPGHERYSLPYNIKITVTTTSFQLSALILIEKHRLQTGSRDKMRRSQRHDCNR
jgi:hypothetical protein